MRSFVNGNPDLQAFTTLLMSFVQGDSNSAPSLAQLSNMNESSRNTALMFQMFLGEYSKTQQQQITEQINRFIQSLTPVPCFNRFCDSPAVWKVPSKGRHGKANIDFCAKCNDVYKRKDFCQYCEQIYTPEQNDRDDKEWVECDHCKRWNHIDCETQFNPQFKKSQVEYSCPDCLASKKKKHQKEQLKRNQTTQVQEYPFIYDYPFMRKVNRKPIQATEVEIPVKKALPKPMPKDNLILPQVTLQVTKEGKTIFSHKLALLDEEIKRDTELIKEEIQAEKNRQLFDQISTTETKNSVEMENAAPTFKSDLKTRSAMREQAVNQRSSNKQPAKAKQATPLASSRSKRTR